MGRPIGWRWWTAIIGTAVLLRAGVVPLVVALGALVVAHEGQAWSGVRQNRTAWVAIGIFALAQTQYAYHALRMNG